MSLAPTTSIDGKKFRWDGRVYAHRDEAGRARDQYESEKFQARVLEEEDGTFRVYTRREVQASPMINDQ